MGRNELALCLKTLYPMIKHRCAREGGVYLTLCPARATAVSL
jgi:hypothetical protein